MSTLANYKVINTSLGTYIKKANIALVKKKSWEVTKGNIPRILDSYSPDEIKLGQLEYMEGSENRYRLSLDGPLYYNLIVFISGEVTLDSPTIPLASYVGLGAVEISEIGLPDTQTYLNLTFNEVDSLLDPDSITISTDLTLTADITNYEDKALGSELGIVDYNSVQERQFKPTSRPELNSSRGISFAPGGMVFNSVFVKKQKLDLDLTSFGNLHKSASIVHQGHSYLRLENDLGDQVLKNTYHESSGLVNLSTSEWNIAVIKEVNYNCLLNPDCLIITNLVNRISYRYKTNDYWTNNYNKISDIPTEDLIPLKRSLKFGTDLDSSNISTIFSDTSKSNQWFLQSSHSRIFENNNTLSNSNNSLGVLTHNNKIFIVAEYQSERIITYYAVDYTGITRKISSEYYLDPEGYLLINTPTSGWFGFIDNLSNPINLTSTYDLYSVIPSGTELLWRNTHIDLSRIILCGDKIQELT